MISATTEALGNDQCHECCTTPKVSQAFILILFPILYKHQWPTSSRPPKHNQVKSMDQLGSIEKQNEYAILFLKDAIFFHPCQKHILDLLTFWLLFFYSKVNTAPSFLNELLGWFLKWRVISYVDVTYRDMSFCLALRVVQLFYSSSREKEEGLPFERFRGKESRFYTYLRKTTVKLVILLL